jgi:hypothetical protein
MSGSIPVVLPTELGYEEIGQLAPTVVNNITILPLQPTQLENTTGNAIIRFRLASAPSRLINLFSLKFSAIFVSESGQIIDPNVGFAGMIQRIRISSGGTTIQDTQNHHLIQAFQQAFFDQPQDQNLITSGTHIKSKVLGKVNRRNIFGQRRSSEAVIHNLVRCAPTGSAPLIGGFPLEKDVATQNTMALNPQLKRMAAKVKNGSEFMTRLDIGLFNYPYSVPEELLKNVEIELTLNPGNMFLTNVGYDAGGQSDTNTTRPTFGAIGKYSLYDIQLAAQEVVVPDELAMKINSNFSGKVLQLPTLQWRTQFANITVKQGQTQTFNIPINEVLSSVRAVFVSFMDLSAPADCGSVGRGSIFALYDPGSGSQWDTTQQAAAQPGLLSAQLILQGTAQVPEIAATTKGEFLDLFQQAANQIGVNRLTIDSAASGLAASTVVPSQVITSAGTTPNITGTFAQSSCSFNEIQLNHTMDDERTLTYGQYSSDHTIPRGNTTSTASVPNNPVLDAAGCKFALGFPVAPSFAATNVLTGVAMQQNSFLRLTIQNGIRGALVGTSADDRDYTVVIHLVHQAIVRLSSMGVADTLN